MLFALTAPDQIDKVQIQTKAKVTEIQTIAMDIITIKTIDKTTAGIHKTTDTTIIAIHRISNKAETIQSNNYVDIV